MLTLDLRIISNDWFWVLNNNSLNLTTKDDCYAEKVVCSQFYAFGFVFSVICFLKLKMDGELVKAWKKYLILIINLGIIFPFL
jgi:predicted membrane-bound dolichyl-phosphate-mannose-protein mannosyltransferase